MIMKNTCKKIQVYALLKSSQLFFYICICSGNRTDVARIRLKWIFSISMVTDFENKSRLYINETRCKSKYWLFLQIVGILIRQSMWFENFLIRNLRTTVLEYSFVSKLYKTCLSLSVIKFFSLTRYSNGEQIIKFSSIMIIII